MLLQHSQSSLRLTVVGRAGTVTSDEPIRSALQVVKREAATARIKTGLAAALAAALVVRGHNQSKGVPDRATMELDGLSAGLTQAARVGQRHGHSAVAAVSVVTKGSPALSVGIVVEGAHGGIEGVDADNLFGRGSRGGADEVGCGREEDGLASKKHPNKISLLVSVAIEGSEDVEDAKLTLK